MFNGFTQETSEFLWELSFNNERPWFLAHKEQFERCLNEPFKALANETNRLMEQRFPLFACRLHIARIYRDARRLFGRGPYKDHLWFSLKSGEIASEGPMFWFEIGPADYAYGMGFYGATPAQMEVYRRSIDANPAAFERLVLETEKSGRFKVEGEEYKRPKGDRGPVINRWYNRRRVGLACNRDFGGELFSPALPEILVDAFEELMPMYEFFLKFYRASLREPQEQQPR